MFPPHAESLSPTVCSHDIIVSVQNNQQQSESHFEIFCLIFKSDAGNLDILFLPVLDNILNLYVLSLFTIIIRMWIDFCQVFSQ